MLAAIVSVGTELTSGQIINKNSAWISQRLKDFGVQTSVHLVVPDERTLIVQALEFCATHCDTMFVTGGLGPTTDDFTRDLISEWAKAPLVFHEPSWQQVCERLSSKGIQVREMQKQQCFFPTGAKVLHNPEGTANGFSLRAHGKDVYVLPGPPSEIAAIWKLNIDPEVKEKTKNIDRHVTYSWDTLGLGESDVAHIVENCLEGIDVEKGYRVHLPYVEVKMSFLESQRAHMTGPMERLNQALSSITVTRNDEQVPELLVRLWSRLQKVRIVDALTGKYLLTRLSSVPAFASRSQTTGIDAQTPEWSLASSYEEVLDEDPHNTLVLSVKSVSNTEALAEIRYKGAVHSDVFRAPEMIAKNSHRKALYFGERAMIFWLRQLEAMV